MGSQICEATGDAGLNGWVTRRLAWWGGQSWLQAGYPAGKVHRQLMRAGIVAEVGDSDVILIEDK
jgi:hypothetical protein